jgi:hypothetical protein
VSELVEQIQIIHETFAIVPVTESILLRASQALPTVVGTLDAIHLSTALILRETEPLDLVATHDQQLAIAARALGFAVTGIE